MISDSDADFEIYYDLLSELQSYAVEVRYPNETIYVFKGKVEEAMQIAKNVRDLVTLKVNLTIDYNEVIDQ